MDSLEDREYAASLRREHRKMVSYGHRENPTAVERFVQYEDDPLPEWAVDVRPYEEE